MTTTTHRLSRRSMLTHLGALATVAAASVLTLSACGKTSGTGAGLGTGTSVATTPADLPQEIKVVSANWNGWDPKHRPRPVTTVIPAKVGASGPAQKFSDSVTITVTKVTPSEVEIKVSEPMAPQGDGGGISHSTAQTVFTLTPGRSTAFATRTLDAGVTYTLTLVDAGSTTGTTGTPDPTETTRNGPPPCGCDLPSPAPSA